MSPDVRWEIPQTIDTIDPLSPHYKPKSAYAKTLRRDGETWGGIVPGTANASENSTVLNGQVSNTTEASSRNLTGLTGQVSERRVHLAHDNSAMDCQICHTSWAPSCFGRHLPSKATQ